jgi:hypothetical protein
VKEAKLTPVIRQKVVDALVPSPREIPDLIMPAEARRKFVWTAGRVLKEAVSWTQVGALDVVNKSEASE